MKIAIEGLDGSGKTTLAKFISKFYKMDYVEKSFKYILTKEDSEIIMTNKEIRQYEKKVCKLNDNLIKAMYYALGNMYDLHHNNNIVIDRYLGSNYFQNGDAKTEFLFSLLAKESADKILTIILYASLEERNKRIKLRNPQDSDLKYKELQIDNYNKLINFYKKYKLPFFVVYVDGKTIDEINHEVIMLIERYKNDKNI